MVGEVYVLFVWSVCCVSYLSGLGVIYMYLVRLGCTVVDSLALGCAPTYTSVCNLCLLKPDISHIKLVNL